MESGLALLLHDVGLKQDALEFLSTYPIERAKASRWLKVIGTGSSSRYPLLTAFMEARQEIDPGSKHYKSTFSAVMKNFYRDPHAAQLAYLHFNAGNPSAVRYWNPDVIAQTVAFNYVTWPRRIREYVSGRDVLDVGCGTGLHGVGYLVVGAKSYTGLDPNINLDRDRAKNLAAKSQHQSFGWTGRELMARMGNFRLVPGTFEDVAPNERFDLVVLHNVTEHLMQIREVFEGIVSRLRPDGRLLFNHHNFYCWNGHHQSPKSVKDIKVDNPEHQKFVDWNHLSFNGGPDHYLSRGLNKIRMEELRDLTSGLFEILEWREIPSSEEQGGARLTTEIMARHPELEDREFRTQNVFCVAKHKSV
jgi:SAM-dependent methyltransferase